MFRGRLLGVVPCARLEPRFRRVEIHADGILTDLSRGNGLLDVEQRGAEGGDPFRLQHLGSCDPSTRERDLDTTSITAKRLSVGVPTPVGCRLHSRRDAHVFPGLAVLASLPDHVFGIIRMGRRHLSENTTTDQRRDPDLQSGSLKSDVIHELGGKRTMRQ